MQHHRSGFILTLAFLGCSPTRSPGAAAPDPEPISNVVRTDSLPLCERSAAGVFVNTPCMFVRDDRTDWSGVALVVNREIICPTRTRADSVPKVDPERLRAIKPETVLAIETVRVVPDSIQRGCAERLRKVIYLVTK